MLLANLSRILFLFLIAFFCSVIISPFVLKLLKNKNAKQEILSYVTQHNSKAGTPTMGGIIFIFSSIVVSLIFIKSYVSVLVGVLLFAVLTFLIGFYDDLKKIKGKKNEGLTPLQKLIFQLLVASAFSIYLYLNNFTFVRIPFVNIVVNLSYFIIPLTIFIIVYFTNSVNLTDGLDGLASTIATTVSVAFGAFLCLFSAIGNFELLKFAEIRSEMGVFLEIFSGAILGFIFFNTYPAKMFMGDSGSLFIGAVLSGVALVTGEIILLLIWGMVFLLECLSVVIQVSYYKWKKKRVFLMTPLHHHFEKKGIHENRIVVGFNFLTIAVIVVTFVLEIILL